MQPIRLKNLTQKKKHLQLHFATSALPRWQYKQHEQAKALAKGSKLLSEGDRNGMTQN